MHSSPTWHSPPASRTELAKRVPPAMRDRMRHREISTTMRYVTFDDGTLACGRQAGDKSAQRAYRVVMIGQPAAEIVVDFPPTILRRGFQLQVTQSAQPMRGEPVALEIDLAIDACRSHFPFSGASRVPT